MTINNILTPLTHMGGGYLNHNKKNYSERRNHGLSLTNLTHCISPSEYCNDYYSNNSFNELNLQLHASSVSNPYSFSIKSNTTISGTIQAPLPSTETILFKKNWDNPLSNIIYKISYTIPAGVKVIKFQTSASCITDKTGGSEPYLDLILDGEYSSLSLSVNCPAYAGYDNSDTQTKYIGVTPGKTYNLYINIDSNTYDSAYLNSDAAICIYYSAEINTHTPDITDY